MPNVPNKTEECICKNDCECNSGLKPTFCCCDACEECPKCGCTDPSACNYDPSKDLDDCSCQTPKGCTDSCDECYNPDAKCSDRDLCCGCDWAKCECAPPYPYYGDWQGDYSG